MVKSYQVPAEASLTAISPDTPQKSRLVRLEPVLLKHVPRTLQPYLPYELGIHTPMSDKQDVNATVAALLVLSTRSPTHPSTISVKETLASVRKMTGLPKRHVETEEVT